MKKPPAVHFCRRLEVYWKAESVSGGYEGFFFEANGVAHFYFSAFYNGATSTGAPFGSKGVLKAGTGFFHTRAGCGFASDAQDDIADVQGLAAGVLQVEIVYEQVGASGRPGDVFAQVFQRGFPGLLDNDGDLAIFSGAPVISFQAGLEAHFYFIPVLHRCPGGVSYEDIE
jgi:hypothetical protein